MSLSTLEHYLKKVLLEEKMVPSEFPHITQIVHSVENSVTGAEKSATDAANQVASEIQAGLSPEQQIESAKKEALKGTYFYETSSDFSGYPRGSFCFSWCEMVSHKVIKYC